MTDQRAEDRAALHGHPSAIEAIAADYPLWEISRRREGSIHSDWEAVRGDVTLTAATPAGLFVRLEAQELSRLQADYPDYRVWRTERYWMASALVDGVAPTLLEETADALEARLRNPGRPIGSQYMLGDT